MGERTGDTVGEGLGIVGEGRVREGAGNGDGTEAWECVSLRGLGSGKDRERVQ